MDQLKFRSFLLQIGKNLKESQFEDLKFVLKGYVTSGACEEMKEVCHYFAELETRRIVTPTNLEILKMALDAIGRTDLVEMVEEKEQFFADLFRAQVKDGDNLNQQEHDAVCDGIAKAAGSLQSLQASSRSGQNTPDVQKQLKAGIENEYDVQIPQFTDALSNGDLLTPVPTHGKQKKDPSMLPLHPTGTQTGVKSAPCSQTGKVAPSGPVLDEAASNTNEDVDVTMEEDLPCAEIMNTEDELDNIDNTIPKEPSESMFTDNTSEEIAPLLKPNQAGESAGALRPTATTPLKIPSHQEPEDIIQTDCIERKEGDSKKVPGDKKTTSKGAEQHDHGGAIPKTSKAKPAGPSGKTKQKAKEQLDEGSANAKQPIESEYAGSASPTGTVCPEDSTDDFPMKDSVESEWPPSGGSCHQGMDKGSPSQGASSSTHYVPHGHSTPSFGSAPSHGNITDANKLYCLQMLQSNPELFNAMLAEAMLSSQQPMDSSSDFPAADSPAQLQSYNKGGYSVVISNGTLCSHSNDKGVVMMESGTQFCIGIANNNNHAAEVDITFGGMFLGVWLVEANRPLSSRLVIEGSSWAKGRLRFFSVSDPRRELEKPSVECYGPQYEFNGKIELEFKPEVLMLKLVVKHVWKEGTKEISMPDFETATIGDLKNEINKNYSQTEVSCLIMSGNILQEDKTMSSYALENTNEVIEVLYMKEELVIESSDMKPIEMTVDPFAISVNGIKEYVKNKIKIPVLEQHLRVNGQNIDEIDDKLVDVFVKSKKTPVVKVDKDRHINIKVSLPNQSQHEVEINWFATVNDLKKILEDKGLYETRCTLKFNNIDISREGGKQLIDLDFKPNVVVTIHSQPQSSHRGFSASNIPSSKSRTRGFGSDRTRGFGDEDSSFGFTQRFRGEGDFHSEASNFRAGPEGMQHDIADSFGREGVAVLAGDDESVYRQFQEDKEEWKFSKDKAVKLIIQLIEKSTGATASSAASSASSMPSQSRYSEVPFSTKYPPPVPD